MRTKLVVPIGALLLATGSAPHGVRAQQSGITRADVQRNDLSLPGREVIQVRVGFAPRAAAARHSHPGEEIAYVLEGRIKYQIDGKPPVTLEPGQALFIPAGAIHAAKNVGDGPAAELATYIVRKDEPLVVAAK